VSPLNPACSPGNIPHCPSSVPVRTNHPQPSIQSLNVLPMQIFWLDLQELLVTLPLGLFLFPRHPPGTHCMHGSSSSPLLPSSHPVPACQIRFTILALYKFCMYVCICRLWEKYQIWINTGTKLYAHNVKHSDNNSDKVCGVVVVQLARTALCLRLLSYGCMAYVKLKISE